jgi:hypothetical protein
MVRPRHVSVVPGYSSFQVVATGSSLPIILLSYLPLKKSNTWSIQKNWKWKDSIQLYQHNTAALLHVHVARFSTCHICGIIVNITVINNKREKSGLNVESIIVEELAKHTTY